MRVMTVHGMTHRMKSRNVDKSSSRPVGSVRQVDGELELKYLDLLFLVDAGEMGDQGRIDSILYMIGNIMTVGS